MPDRVLTQEEIDGIFRKLKQGKQEDEILKNVAPYDFRRPDRIAKDQLRAIHLLHENFARSLASSLAAYLRAFVAVNLVSVEQLSFMEFAQGLPSPTSVIPLGMKPYDGSALLEIGPTLVFPILEMLLGWNGKAATKITRGVTEIEQSILESLLRVILHDLRGAWSAVATIAFEIEGHENEPALLQLLAPNEAVIAVSIEVRIGDTSGIMNIGIPSTIVKMLRHKFDQQWSMRKSKATEEDQGRILQLLRQSVVQADARLRGPAMSVSTLLDLQEGDVLALDHPVERSLELSVNGPVKYRGGIVALGRKRAFQIQEPLLLQPAAKA